MQNPYIILQARMNSERLPGKVMREVAGKPLIGILINRLKASGIPIVLATSTNPENDVLVEYVKGLGVKVFRGSEDNVLERYYLAAKEVNADVIIRITGDNPLIDGLFVKELVSQYYSLNNFRTYMSPGKSKTFPLGMSFEIFSNKLLAEAYEKSTKKGELEHVTPYLHQNIPGDINILKIFNFADKSNYRLTVDTPEDFEVINKLIETFECDKKTYKEIISILDNNTELFNINKTVKQRDWDS